MARYDSDILNAVDLETFSQYWNGGSASLAGTPGKDQALRYSAEAGPNMLALLAKGSPLEAADGRQLLGFAFTAARTTGNYMTLRARAGSDYTDYHLEYKRTGENPTTGKLRIIKYSPSFTLLASVPFALDEGVRAWMEFEASGTVLRGRAWLVGDPVPGWMVTAEDAALTSGAVGFGTYTDSDFVADVFQYTVGTDGDAPPEHPGDVPALAPSFRASAANIVAGGTVAFTDTTSGGTAPYAYSWRKDGDEFSTAPNSALRFAAAGSFAITLTVTDAAGATATTDATVITVDQSAKGPTIEEPADRGNVDVAASSVLDNADGSFDVRIVPRKQDNNFTGDRWWYHYERLTGATEIANVIIAYDVDGDGVNEGKDAPANRRWLGHRACFTYDDPDDPRAVWSYFRSETLDGYDRVYPASFRQEVVHVAYHPVVTEAQIAARVADAVASGHVSETPSSVAASGLPVHVIAETEATVNEEGKAIPPLPIYGFAIGTGSDRIALVTGQHPGEDHGDRTFWAVVDGLLADTVEAAYLRERFTICCYPNVNPTGRYGGHHRSVYPQDPAYDPNRDWTYLRGYEVRTVHDAIIRDADGHNLRVFCDFHGSNVADSYIITASTDGKTPDVPGVASFLTAMREFYPTLDFVDSNLDTVSERAFDVADGFPGMRANFELETVDTNANQDGVSGALGAAFVAALHDRAKAGDYDK